jgi:hypothetical protein
MSFNLLGSSNRCRCLSLSPAVSVAAGLILKFPRRFGELFQRFGLITLFFTFSSARVSSGLTLLRTHGSLCAVHPSISYRLIRGGVEISRFLAISRADFLHLDSYGKISHFLAVLFSLRRRSTVSLFSFPVASAFAFCAAATFCVLL